MIIKEINQFLKGNKNYIYLALLFVIFFIFLYIITPIPEDIREKLLSQLQEYISSIITHNQFRLAWNIFINNTLVSFFILLFGFLLSIGSILIVFSNVFAIGIAFSLGIEKIGFYKSILAILPHGIFEISAIILTFALSLKITHLILKKVWNWKKTKIFPEIKKIFLFWLSMIIPLLFIAAIIETFLTPLFIK